MQTRWIGCGCFTLYVTAIRSVAASRYATAWCSTDVLWSRTTGWEHVKSRILSTFSMPFHLIASRFWAACHSMLCRVKTLIKYFHWKTFRHFFIDLYSLVVFCDQSV